MNKVNRSRPFSTYDEARRVENKTGSKTGIYTADMNLGRLWHAAGPLAQLHFKDSHASSWDEETEDMNESNAQNRKTCNEPNMWLIIFLEPTDCI